MMWRGIRFFSLTLLLLVLSACGSSSNIPTSAPIEPSPTEEEEIRPVEITPTAIALPTVSSTSAQSGDSESRPIAEASLNEIGPWFVFKTDEGIWAANPDGTGLTQLISQPMMKHFDYFIQASPVGGRVAYLTGREMYYNLALNLIELPQGSHQVVTKLTSSDTEPGADALPGDEIFNPLRAIVEVPSIAWSPDGRRLAFMGVMDGDSSDLYVYSIDDDSMVRLTDGPSEGIRPIWSPDGEVIVHFGVTTMGTGAGANLSGAWAARADDTSVQDLYDPGNSGDEIVLGWVNETTFVVYAWTPGCGLSSLRTYDMRTTEMRVLWEHAFDHIAFDPETNTIFLSTNRDAGACNPEGESGLYWMSVDDAAELQVVEDAVGELSWDEDLNLLLASTEFGALAVSPNGEFIDLDKPPDSYGLPAASGISRMLAWVGDGLWIGPLLGSIDSPPEKIFDAATNRAYWSPNGRTLLFFADDGLYAAREPAYEAVLVASGLSARPWKGFWVEP